MRTGQRITCPKCKRKGEVRLYDDGTGLVVHASKATGAFNVVTDSCYLSKADRDHMKA